MSDHISYKPMVIVLTGPTGIGKSALLRSLYHHPIAVINADSRQVYKHMKIGTSAPLAEDFSKATHLGFGIITPDQPISAGKFVKILQNSINHAIKKKLTPVIVGGSFFYIKSLWDGLSPIPEISTNIKDKVGSLSLQEALNQLIKVDPQSANNINHSNQQRIRRALMVYLQTGKPFSKFSLEGGLWKQFSWEPICIKDNREILYQKINNRVEKMFAEGLVEEVCNLLKLGYTSKSPGLNSIGYREILEAINQKEDLKHKNLISCIQQNTRKFAKRQMTWFRHEPRLKTFDQTHALFYLSKILKNYL